MQHKKTASAGAAKTKNSAVKDLLVEKKESGMKKPLLLHTDDDSDEDGNEYTNPVAKAPKDDYKPPALNLSGVSAEETKDLAGTPRSQLSASERRQVDQEAIAEVLNEEMK